MLARHDEGKIVSDSSIGLSHLVKLFPQPSSNHRKICWVCADERVHAPIDFIGAMECEISVPLGGLKAEDGGKLLFSVRG